MNLQKIHEVCNEFKRIGCLGKKLPKGSIQQGGNKKYKYEAKKKLCAKIKAKSLNVNKRTREYKKKGCITNFYVKRAATEEAELEQLPADGG